MTFKLLHSYCFFSQAIFLEAIRSSSDELLLWSLFDPVVATGTMLENPPTPPEKFLEKKLNDKEFFHL